MARSGAGQGGLVYSTEAGRMCPDCRQPLAQCRCKEAAAPVGNGKVRVRLETKGRKGKGVTVVEGLPLDAAALAQLGKRLKAACGTGGTIKDGLVEVQGDHCTAVIALLQGEGYAAKRVGGGA